jgi:CHAT domain-containing protein
MTILGQEQGGNSIIAPSRRERLAGDGKSALATVICLLICLLTFPTVTIAQSALARAGQTALAGGDLETALEAFANAAREDPLNGELQVTVSALATDLGTPELALSLRALQVEQGLNEGDYAAVASGNAGITELMSLTPAWVQARVAAAGNLGEDEQAAFEAWNEMQAEAKQLMATDLAAARDSQETALLIAEESFGGGHWITAVSLRDMGVIYRNLGMAAEAEESYTGALAIAGSVLGENHPETVQIIGLLAELSEVTGDADQALGLRDMARSLLAESFGPDHALTLAGAYELALTMDGVGMSAESVSLLAATCGQVGASYGAYHPSAIDCAQRLAESMTNAGAFDDAAIVYQNNIKLLAASNAGTTTQALTYVAQLAEIYREQGRYSESQELLAGVEATAAQAGETETLILARSYLGRVLNNTGNYEGALQLTGSVLDHGRANWQGRPLEVLNTMTVLGDIYGSLGRLGDAEVIFEEALAGFTSVVGGGHPSTIVALSNLGQIYEKEGLYDLAEPALAGALEQAKSVFGDEDGNTQRIRNNLALFHESQGSFREAEPLYLQSLAALERIAGPTHSDTIAVRNNLGFLYMMMEDFAAAAPIFQTVNEQWQLMLGRDHQNTLKAANNLGRVHLKTGDLGAAEQLFTETLATRASVLGAEHLDTLRSMIDLGSLYTAQERTVEAIAMLEKALALAEATLGAHHPYAFDALNALAEAQEKAELLTVALDTRERGFRRRSEFLDRMLWVTGENAREGYLRLHRPEFDRFLALVARVGGDSAGRLALDASLQRKGLLLKITSEIQQIAQLSKDASLTALAGELEAARKQLAANTLSGPTPETAGRHTEVLYQLETRVNELQAELGRASVRYRSSIAHVSAGEVPAQLQSGTALVDFLMYRADGEDRVLASVVARDGETVKYDLVRYPSRTEIEDVVLEYRSIIQDDSADEDELLELGQLAHELIWQPIVAVTGAMDYLYLVPDGILNILPFNALINAEEIYVIQSHDLHILTSARDLLPNEFELAEGQYVIVAGPDYDSDKVTSLEELAAAQGRRSTVMQLGIRGGAAGLRGLNFEPLPGAEKEGQLIVDRVVEGEKASQVFFRGDAQEQVLAGLSRPPEILHIATHGFFLEADDNLRKRLLKLQRGTDLHVPPPGDNPLLRAGLAFAGINTNAQFLCDIDTVNDGMLTALEVLGLNLTGTRLVVLSACETGLGEIHEGEGVYGLRRSFQEAGVAEVVSSLWEVSDAGTQALMTSFYNRMLSGEQARDALRATQLEMIDSPEWGYPYVWSAFMIVGSYESAGYAIN